MKTYKFEDLIKMELAFPEVICPDLVNHGDIILISAKPKTFKSITARNLAYQLSTGGNFLGRSCKEVKVLYLALEEKPYKLREHLKQIGVEKENQNFFTAWGFETDNSLAEIAKVVEENKIEVVFIDTLIRAFDIKDINCYVETNKLFKRIKCLRDELELTVILIHHAGKNSNEGSDYLGSTGLHSSVDNLIILKRKDGRLVLSTKPRADEPIEDLYVPIDLENLKVSELPSKSYNTDNRISEDILKFIKANPNCTKTEITNGITGKSSLIIKQINNLVQCSKLLEKKEGQSLSYTFPLSSPIDEEDRNISQEGKLEGSNEN